MDSVEDSRDIDDDSIEILATELINKTDLDDVILEVNNLDFNDILDAQNASTAILGSWYSTPKKYRIQTLTRMYGNGSRDKDDYIFDKSIQEMDWDRDYHYHSKLDVTNDLDNIYGDQHQVCADKGLNHKSELELVNGQDGDLAECFVLNINKRKYYALSWEEISEAAEEDIFLIRLKTAMISDNNKEMEELLKDKRIHCSENKNGISAIKVEDLSLYRNVIMVRN